MGRNRSTPTDLEREGRRNMEEEGEEELEGDSDERAVAAVQKGDKWHHTYLYLTHVDGKEREKLISRPLLY